MIKANPVNVWWMISVVGSMFCSLQWAIPKVSEWFKTQQVRKRYQGRPHNLEDGYRQDRCSSSPKAPVPMPRAGLHVGRAPMLHDGTAAGNTFSNHMSEPWDKVDAARSSWRVFSTTRAQQPDRVVGGLPRRSLARSKCFLLGLNCCAYVHWTIVRAT